jgi:hypothetical protein
VPIHSLGVLTLCLTSGGTQHQQHQQQQQQQQQQPGVDEVPHDSEALSHDGLSLIAAYADEATQQIITLSTINDAYRLTVCMQDSEVEPGRPPKSDTVSSRSAVPLSNGNAKVADLPAVRVKLPR